jgi:hypothetical protein
MHPKPFIMKIKSLIVLSLTIVLAACNKQNTNSRTSAAVNTNAIQFTDTVKIPITDLAKRTYLGFTGGLYPGGINRPTGAYKRDLQKFAGLIKPLNKIGISDSVVGRICFISLGGSTSGHLMDSLKQKTMRDTATNSFLKLLNCSNGGGRASFQQIMNPNDPYWDHVRKIITTSSVTYNQVQVIYLESEDSLQMVSFPERPLAVKDDIAAAVRTCKTKFANLKLVYLLGRTTTFDDGVNQVTNTEPCPYYNGWACKFMIEDQINGVAGTQYKGDSAVSPLVTWGWYEWADGTSVPRKDGFVWPESMTADGLHASNEGEDTLATRFKNFLLTDPYANIWYGRH